VPEGQPAAPHDSWSKDCVTADVAEEDPFDPWFEPQGPSKTSSAASSFEESDLPADVELPADRRAEETIAVAARARAFSARRQSYAGSGSSVIQVVGRSERSKSVPALRKPMSRYNVEPSDPANEEARPDSGGQSGRLDSKLKLLERRSRYNSKIVARNQHFR